MSTECLSEANSCCLLLEYRIPSAKAAIKTSPQSPIQSCFSIGDSFSNRDSGVCSSNTGDLHWSVGQVSS